MSILKSMMITISMYTKIPVPYVEWNSSNLRYSLCFLGVPGIIAAAAEVLWLLISMIMGIPQMLYALIACILPLAVTGAIHMDGFADTVDAVSSRTDMKRRLEIMDDPHIGSFGVLAICIYIMSSFVAFYEMYSAAGLFDYVNIPVLMAAVFVTSRVLTAFNLMFIPNSKNEGLLYTFTAAASRRTVITVSAATVLFIAGMMFGCFGFPGGLAYIGVIVSGSIYFRYMCMNQFGGISGDLCGWFIQVMEIIFMAVAVLCLKSV